MPRVVCVYFPYLSTDRIRRHGEATVPVDQPLVVISKSGPKRCGHRICEAEGEKGRMTRTWFALPMGPMMALQPTTQFCATAQARGSLFHRVRTRWNGPTSKHAARETAT
jgi:hypothetical protein